MAEIIYYYCGTPVAKTTAHIKWLQRDDLQCFNHHLLLCNQNPLDTKTWDSIYDEGTMYALLFVHDLPVARACVEKYSKDMWEVADVRVVKAYRNNGFASEISRFVTSYILSHGKTPTIRTEEDNFPMKKVICRLGFRPFVTPLSEQERDKEF